MGGHYSNADAHPHVDAYPNVDAHPYVDFYSYHTNSYAYLGAILSCHYEKLLHAHR